MPDYRLARESGLYLAYARLTGPKGSRLVRLAVDTGATSTMVPQKAALAVGVNPARARYFRETLTASGKELIPFVRLPGVKLFGRSFRRVAVACHDLPAESPIDGLLGLDLLSELGAVLDLRAGIISVR